MKIKRIIGYELLDSRGNPTVGAKIISESGFTGFAISPSGASTGKYEAHELRDNDKMRYSGKGTLRATENINGTINNNIAGKEIKSQKDFDNLLKEIDGTENKKNLGANAILAASLAFAKCCANENNLPLYKYLNDDSKLSLPRPMMNILNGGAHALNNIDIQEFMIIPDFEESFSAKLCICAEIYHKLGEILKDKGLACGVGDEGGYAPQLSCDEEAIELIISAIENAGYSTKNVKIGLDIAASEWFENGIYQKPKAMFKMTPDELLYYYRKICSDYPIISIEDPFSEEDFKSFTVLTERIGKNVQIVGDDLFVTNTQRLSRGISEKSANSILIKPNQIGTLSETIDVINLAKKSGYKTIISHRSGETEDTTISDIAVAFNIGQIKTGAPCRTDRTAKYNRLLVIEDEINS